MLEFFRNGGINMAKPKNNQAREMIARAAYHLFLQKGYVNTSYQDISDFCECKRTLVQYYYPQKTHLVISFFENLLTETMEYIKDNKQITDNNFVNLFIIGQIHFAFLFKDEKAKMFTFDIISSRMLTEEILLFNSRWAMNYLKVEDSKQSKQLIDDITYNMGGFYELVYQYLKNNIEMDIPHQLSKVIISIIMNLGESDDNTVKILSNHSINPKDILEIVQKLEGKLL